MGKGSYKIEFRAKLWMYDGPAAWCFVTMPKVHSREVRKLFQIKEEGWGRLKARATIGESTWMTSIWFDTKADSYLLPVKVAIRKKEKLVIGKMMSVMIEIDQIKNLDPHMESK